MVREYISTLGKHPSSSKLEGTVKYPKFIIILVVILLVVAGCRGDEPAEEDVNGSVPREYNYASGFLKYPVLLNSVGIEVQTVGLPAMQEDANNDYVQVLLQLTVTNESESVVVPPGMMLVDDHNNIYVSWQEPLPYEDQLTRMPLSVDTGESATGNLIYIIPIAATQDNLRLRWESDLHKSRIDVFLGPIGGADYPE
jgi:hypothetical protein